MTRVANPVPSYTSNGKGYGRIYWLGVYRILPGKFGSPESLKEYARLCSIVADTGHLPVSDRQKIVTVREMCTDFIAAMFKRYGTKSKVPQAVSYGVIAFAKEYGDRSVKTIKPVDIERLRDNLVKKYCRNTVNRRVRHIVRAFEWAETRGFVDANQRSAIASLERIKEGMEGSFDYDDVEPVSDADYNAVIEIANFRLRCMMQVQRATGMRSGELVSMTPEDVDMTQDDWLYIPVRHKTQKKKCARIVGIPREIVPLLQSIMPEPHIPWFPIQVGTYRNNLLRACDRVGIERFYPHRLRHTLATHVKEVVGEHEAAIMLSVTAKTIKTYAKTTPKGVRRIMDQIRERSSEMR